MDPKPLPIGKPVKVIIVDLVNATEKQPERYFHAEVVEQEDWGFWANVKGQTTHPYSNDERLPGEYMELNWEEEYISFRDVANVILETDEYPNMKDPLIRFVLEGPNW